MYIISCCRIGSFNSFNRKSKGIFKKKFKTLSDLTNFWMKSKRKVYFPNIRNELTKNELEILNRKCHAVAYKNNKI